MTWSKRGHHRRHVGADVGDDVVGEAGGGESGCDHAIERDHHLGPDRTFEQGEHVGPGHAVPEPGRLVGEGDVELLGGDRAALDLGPGVGVRVDGVDGAQEADREIAPALVLLERIERARQDHPAEVPEHRCDVRGHDHRSCRNHRRRRATAGGLRWRR